ncbi:Eco57I restriction-modification methylase domain-containing protein [Erysipelotrichaceae bacterium OttesenSCG-928-M19]|nr:Eco57I restriction-modification methylase domain-containing protein [Erysipelotrichaceae bacterium OttesenSCG-928-M19]
MNDIYRSFYTKNHNITSYMVSMLKLSENDHVLEPCGGDGVFVDALLEKIPELKIDTCDLDISAINILKNKYHNKKNVLIRETDTLIDETFDIYAITGYYDKIIGNPPYGGWQEYERRINFKEKYKGFYVKETYSLFLLRCVSLLKEKGILSFIIPDTFLYLHNHKKLREYILKNTIIKEIVIFPSKFFPGVSFGYSNLCIITLQREKIEANISNEISVIKGLKSDKDLFYLSSKRKKVKCEEKKIKQIDILNNPEYAFLIGDEQIGKSIKNTKNRLIDIADCVTGIYCGDNKKFLALESTNKRDISGYKKIEYTEIDFNHNSILPVTEPKKYIQIIKGSSSTPYFRTADKWLINWSEFALNYYNTDKKARFQNFKYYFKKGIAVPMVKSSKIKATLMDGFVFDQSIVGIFPKDEKYILYILAFLNSEIANQYIHMINPTANNSANYLKKLPIYIPNEEELNNVNKWVSHIIIKKDYNFFQKEINFFFNDKMKSE